jgi:hypothetical protein
MSGTVVEIETVLGGSGTVLKKGAKREEKRKEKGDTCGGFHSRRPFSYPFS